MNCRIASPWVTALGSGEDVAFAPVRNHIDSCLNCQASVARQRRLRRNLQALATDSENAPPSTASQSGERTGASGRPLVVGAIGAAVAIGIGVAGFRRSVAG